MSDLISREEVLDLLDTAFESGAFDGRYAYENLIDAVQNLIHPLETDLVSRQAVIDTIETNCSWDIFNEWGSRTPTGENIINAIKSVPSVEPEKCGDCISRQAVLREFTCLSDDAFVINSTIQKIVKNLPSVELEKIINNKVHLCESCKYQYPDCPSSSNDSIFGDDIGNDNICCCNKYECKSFVEPEKKSGKWIKHERAEESNGRLIPNYECNQCHAWKLEDSDYCPDCSAKMEVDRCQNLN